MEDWKDAGMEGDSQSSNPPLFQSVIPPFFQPLHSFRLSHTHCCFVAGATVESEICQTVCGAE